MTRRTREDLALWGIGIVLFAALFSFCMWVDRIDTHNRCVAFERARQEPNVVLTWEDFSWYARRCPK